MSTKLLKFGTYALTAAFLAIAILNWFFPSSFSASLGWLNAAAYFYLRQRDVIKKTEATQWIR